MLRIYVITLLCIVSGCLVSSKTVLEAYQPSAQLLTVEDCGDPLILTPYIKAGKLKEAQKLSRVSYPAFRSVHSYSGFFTVNETHNSNQFFWYFEAASSSSNAPVILWLQGGPGSSSLFGLFAENGPFYFKRGHIRDRKYSWHKNNHLIYIDNPVGTGFSFTEDGYAQNETVVGNDLYNALSQFFTLFPNLQKNDFYVVGESYAGKYVPAVCHTIHNRNKNETQKINLQGFAIGNGLSDPLNQLFYSDYVYQLGLVDRNGRDQIAALEEKGKQYIKAQKWMEAYQVFDQLINSDMYPYGSLFFNLTGFTSYFNYLHFKEDPDFFDQFLQTSEVRKALHVGNIPFNNGSEVRNNMKEDMMKSVAPWVSELLSHYRGVIYNGQLDIIVAYPLTENYLANLNFSSSAEFKNASRCIWKVDGIVAGYAKTAGNLTEVLVRDAGHMVPTDQPKWAMDLINRLTKNKKFN